MELTFHTLLSSPQASYFSHGYGLAGSRSMDVQEQKLVSGRVSPKERWCVGGNPGLLGE
jgi:hypothetical protein